MFPWRKNLQIFPRGTGNLLGSGIIARDPSVKVKRGQKDGSRRSNPSVNPPEKTRGKVIGWNLSKSVEWKKPWGQKDF